MQRLVRHNANKTGYTLPDSALALACVRLRAGVVDSVELKQSFSVKALVYYGRYYNVLTAQHVSPHNYDIHRPSISTYKCRVCVSIFFCFVFLNECLRSSLFVLIRVYESLYRIMTFAK